MCGRCGKNGMLTDNVTGERFCGKCGFVISETLQDAGPEWRSFSKEGGADPTRTGAPTSLTMHDRGLATIINPLNKDASGKPLSTTMKSTIERLRTWDSRSQVHEPVDRNLRQALSDLNKLKDKKYQIVAYPIHETWADVGRPKDWHDVNGSELNS